MIPKQQSPAAKAQRPVNQPALNPSVETSKSLLQSAKHDPTSAAWFQLHKIYDPLIAGWVVRAGVEESEVGDITQEVLTAVSQELPNFDHNGRVGAFRSWLKLITVNRCRRYWDKKKRQVPIETGGQIASGIGVLNELEDPRSDVSQLWDSEHDSYVFENLLNLIRSEFDAQVFDVFVRNTINGDSPKVISEELGLTVSRVYKMKFRVMQRLRQVADGLLDDISPE